MRILNPCKPAKLGKTAQSAHFHRLRLHNLHHLHESHRLKRHLARCSVHEETIPSTPRSGSDGNAAGGETRFRRAVFSFDRWTSHRSRSRYSRHMAGILTSRTFLGLARPLATLTTVGILAGTYQTLLDMGKLQPLLRFDLTSGPFEITSFALSLLLVFRTDSSYSRWNQALTTWSTVRNVSKELARIGVSALRDSETQQLMLVRWIIAFSHALKVRLRTDCNIDEEVGDVLLPHELAALKDADYSPHFALQVITGVIDRGGLGPQLVDRMLDRVGSLSAAVGVCDAILRYPIPLSYTRHTSRFMITWLSCLPFAFWANCGWAVVPITTVIGYLLLGIEDIGVQIEEPFGILPLEDICGDIATDVNGMLRHQSSVVSLLVDAGSSGGSTGDGGAEVLRRDNGALGSAGGPESNGSDGCSQPSVAAIAGQAGNSTGSSNASEYVLYRRAGGRSTPARSRKRDAGRIDDDGDADASSSNGNRSPENLLTAIISNIQDESPDKVSLWD